jgi:RNA polymerase sigma-70 factor (ECF subfamily)
LWQLGTLIDIDSIGGATERPATPEATPRSVEEYLAELPAARREVLVMKHSLGYTTEEIAELTDNPVGTVKDRLVAARKQLRKLIVRDMRSWGRGQEGSRHD